MDELSCPVVAFVILCVLAALGGIGGLTFFVVSVLETMRCFFPHQNVNVTIDDTVCFEDVKDLKFILDGRQVSFTCSAGDVVMRYSKIRVDTVSYSWFGRVKGKVRPK